MTSYTTKRQIPFQIDKIFHEGVNRHKWLITNNGYVGADIRGKRVLLHQFLFGKAKKGFCWDHINRDKLDNRQENLRIVSYAENRRNTKFSINNKSGRKGVHQIKGGYWIATVGSVYLGCYTNFKDAVSIRQRAEDLLSKLVGAKFGETERPIKRRRRRVE